MKASYYKYILKFKRPSGTSRGVLTEKETWLLYLEDGARIGIGECGLLRTLSIDDRPDYEQHLRWVCENIHLGKKELWERLAEFPSLQYGVEMAFDSFEADHPFEIYPSAFTQGQKSIAINGLIWMGDSAFMKEQVEEKVKEGFSCIKLKIGAIEFEKELEIIRLIRENFSSELEIRLDVNGGFNKSEALSKLKTLSQYKIHSVEQPIKPGQYSAMADLCQQSPIPIALDEELIGVSDVTKKRNLIQIIQPHYVIFKPSLIGGFRAIEEWRQVLGKTGWWITSALESNVGLNAIAQRTFNLSNPMPQGLGTGSLYTNNFESPLEVKGAELWHMPNKKWNFNLF